MFYLVDGRGGSKSRSKCHSWSWLGDQVTSLTFVFHFLIFSKENPPCSMENPIYNCVIWTLVKIPCLLDYKNNHDYVTSIVVEVGHEAEGEGPPEVTEPEELGLLVIIT